jgi:hypothetical protein
MQLGEIGIRMENTQSYDQFVPTTHLPSNSRSTPATLTRSVPLSILWRRGMSPGMNRQVYLSSERKSCIFCSSLYMVALRFLFSLASS